MSQHDPEFSPSGVELMSATDAAIAALLWSTPADSGDSTGVDGYLEDIDAEFSEVSRAKLHSELCDFIVNNSDDLSGIDYSSIGHNFVLTRNGHGTGFWDLGMGERGDRLSAACDSYGPIDAYVGDDWIIYTL